MWSELVILAGTTATGVATLNSAARDPFGNDPLRLALVPAYRQQHFLALWLALILSSLALLAVLRQWHSIQLILGAYLICGSCLAIACMRGWQNRRAGTAPQLLAFRLVLGWPLVAAHLLLARTSRACRAPERPGKHQDKSL